MADSSSRERKVRGRKITSSREEKEARRAKKRLNRATGGGSNGSGFDAGRDVLTPPEDAAPDPFVATDEIDDLTERIGRWLDAEQPVHLIGPTGSGKTALALHAASRRGRPVVWINGDEAIDTAALVGEHSGSETYSERDAFVNDVVKETEVVRERWVDNPLTVAAREGATLVYNEFSRSNPEAHNVLLSVLEEGVLERPEKHGEDRAIDVHPEFRAIVTSNDLEYAGVHEQQDALLDRFVGVHIGYYDRETEVEIVAAHVDVPRERIERVVDATRTLRDELDVVIGTRVAITAAKGLAAFSDDSSEDDAETDGETDIDRDVLATVFTDVLAPKVAERGDVTDLRERIDELL